MRQNRTLKTNKQTHKTKQMHLCRFLQSEAKGADHLVLWLDCDREGENICFEVMEHTVPWMRRPQQQQQQQQQRGQQQQQQTVWRARFSAISAAEIKGAMVRGARIQCIPALCLLLHAADSTASVLRPLVCSFRGQPITLPPPHTHTTPITKPSPPPPPPTTPQQENLTAPNRAEAEAVDARQELDLKVGVAFTRFQTRFFQGRYGNLDAAVVSYG